MDKSTKLYKHAMERYQSGYIDEAIEACEKSISLNIKNSAAINLKGLLLYLKGELETSRNIWKMNKDVNKDSVSKMYIESSYSDEDKWHMYETAIGLIREVKINEALEFLEKCNESDFNAINVGNAMASCFIKQGEYNKAIEYIDKVLTINKRDKIARENKKMLIQYEIIKKEVDYSKIFKILGVVVVLFIVVYLGVENKNKIVNGIKNISLSEKKKPKEEVQNIVQQVEKVVDKPEPKKEEPASEVKNEPKVQAIFPMEEIKIALEKRNYEELFKYYSDWKDKVSAINEKSLVGSMEEVLKKEGMNYFYTLGNQYTKEQNNVKAIESLNKAYRMGNSTELYEHVIFTLGAAYERVSDYENALKLYEEYYSNYSKGDYGDEVLYRMALIYKNVDKSKAKRYAEELIREYPKSIYNNSKTKGIINGD
jgi:tetratricopeptide (TPR) repeat protein